MSEDLGLPEWWPFKPGAGNLWSVDQINALHRAVDSKRLPQIIALGDWLDREPCVHLTLVDLGMPTEILLQFSACEPKE